MKCFRVTCNEHHPSMSTWLAGGLLASIGSPLALPLLKGKMEVDNLPTAKAGLFLEDMGAYMLTRLRLAPWPDSINTIVDTTVKQRPDCFECGEPGYSPVLKRASVEMRDGKPCLTPEHADDENRALIVLNAGRGNRNCLNYMVGGAQVFQTVEGLDPIILAALSPGEKIVAVRSNWRWQNLFGLKSRKTMEQIEICFDGENIQVIIAD